MSKVTTVSVTAKNDFLSSMATNTRPIVALSELIWNGFDAKSETVAVDIDTDDMKGMQAITVRDGGDGIDHRRIDHFFGSLGESWKKKAQRNGDRVLHGKHGRGRFKAFALGEAIEWDTTYQTDGSFYKYKISGLYYNLKDFSISVPEQVEHGKCGTEVRVSQIAKYFRSLDNEATPFELAKIFALYLSEYPHLRLFLNGVKIDPGLVQNYKKDYTLSPITLPDGQTAKASVTIIEWKTVTERKIYLCDSKGAMLGELDKSPSVHAKGFNFIIYIKSDYFKELDSQNALELAEMTPEVKAIVDQVTDITKAHFRERKLEGSEKLVDEWKAEKIYPYVDKPDIGPIEIVERQVFNILAVNVHEHLPKFESAELKLKEFIFRLLYQALQQNPESLQRIITDVLKLTKEKQDEFAKLLEKTSLSSVISAGKIVTDRLDFLAGLESLLFDPKTKKQLTERSQLHKVMETEAWIFREDFFLTNSEVWLEDALTDHLDILRPEAKKQKKKKSGKEQILTADGKRGRLDLLCRSRMPRDGEYDYLVVELKRPSVKIDQNVINQVEKYAMAVSGDARFATPRCHWTFIAVSNDLDEYAKMRASQEDRPKGYVSGNSKLNFTVWVYEWAEIIASARTRLEFFKKQLDYTATKENAQEYLKETYAKYLPVLEGDISENKDQPSPDDDDSEAGNSDNIVD